jgi:hypothetical protein
MPGKDAKIRVTVQNVGLGTARNLTIQSMQPRVVGTIPAYPIDPLQDANPGPVVAFNLTGSSNTADSSGFQANNLTINFGNGLPGGTVSGFRTLRSSQKGFFIDISSTFSHQDYQGVTLDPLIFPPTTSLVPAIGGTVTGTGGQPFPFINVTLTQNGNLARNDLTDSQEITISRTCRPERTSNSSRMNRAMFGQARTLQSSVTREPTS